MVNSPHVVNGFQEILGLYTSLTARVGRSCLHASVCMCVDVCTCVAASGLMADVRQGLKRVWTIRGRRDVASRCGGILHCCWIMHGLWKRGATPGRCLMRADGVSLYIINARYRSPGRPACPPHAQMRRDEALPACHAEQWSTVSGTSHWQNHSKDTSHPTGLNDVSTPTPSCRDNKNTQDKKKKQQRRVMSNNGMFRHVSWLRICSAFALNELSQD